MSAFLPSPAGLHPTNKKTPLFIFLCFLELVENVQEGETAGGRGSRDPRFGWRRLLHDVCHAHMVIESPPRLARVSVPEPKHPFGSSSRFACKLTQRDWRHAGRCP